MSTTVLNPRDVGRSWHVIDAAQRPLGRVATEVATLLRGKHKPAFHPSQDIGDYVIVVNAAQVSVSGRKLDQKVYYRHSGFPGGLREVPIREMLQKRPERVIEHAVRGMLPQIQARSHAVPSPARLRRTRPSPRRPDRRR